MTFASSVSRLPNKELFAMRGVNGAGVVSHRVSIMFRFERVLVHRPFRLLIFVGFRFSFIAECFECVRCLQARLQSIPA